MNQDFFLKKYLDNNVLIENILGGGEFRIKRPCKIIIQANVINKLKEVYIPNGERGGFLELVSLEPKILRCVQFHSLDNVAVLNYNFTPNQNQFATTLNAILNRGSVPIFIHTHPTNLGLESYDKRNINFYLRSSAPDRKNARTGVTNFLNMPEAIFVKDNRFDKGFAISFYTGVVFPQSSSALSTFQIATGSAALLLKNKAAKFISLAAFGLGFARKPKYKYLDNGGVEVSLSV